MTRPKPSNSAPRRWLVALLAILTMGLVVVPVAPALAADGAMSLTVALTDANGNPISVVDASVAAEYEVRVGYGCNVSDCTGVKVNLAATPLDPTAGLYRKETGYTFTPPFTPAPSITGNINTGLTIDLSTVAAGTSGQFRIRYATAGNAGRVGSLFPDGSPITPEVTMTATNSATVTDTSATARWKVYTQTPTLVVTPGVQRVNTDTQLTVTASSRSGCYRVQNGQPVGIPQNLCGASGNLVVDLPAKAEYVAGSGGTYDPVTRAVMISGSTDNIYRQILGSFKVTFPSSAYPTTGDACVANESFTAHDVSYTYVDGTVKTSSPATATGTVAVGNCAPFAKGSGTKLSYRNGNVGASNVWNIPASEAAAYGAYWAVNANNQSNVAGRATIQDSDLLHDDLDVTAISVPTGGPANITYTLDDGTTGSATGVTTLSAPAGRRYAAVTATSGLLAPPNVKPSDTAVTQFQVRFSFTLHADATVGERTNTAIASIVYPGHPELGTHTVTGSPMTRTVTLAPPSESVTLTANPVGSTVTGGGVALVGGEVAWRGTGSATNLTPATAWTPQYVYLAPRGWDIVPGGASLTTPVPGATFDYRTVSYLGNSHQAVVVNWPAPLDQTGTFLASQLVVRTTPTGAAPAGTNNQTAYLMVGDAANVQAGTYANTRVVDTTDLDGDGLTDDAFSRNSGTTSLAASPAIGIVKEICKPNAGSADGCTWLADSSVRVGVPPTSSSIKYRVTLKNVGNAPLTNAVAYDVLPYIGDTGTTTATANTPRGSTVNEQLSTVSDVSSGVTMSYSSSTNPPRSEVYTGATTGDWTAPLIGARAVRAQVSSLAPGESKSFTYTAALVGGSADQVACNSVAVSASGLVAVEPSAVCATTQEADLSVESADRLPLQAGRVGMVPFVVTNGGGSQSAAASVIVTIPAEVQVRDLAVPGWSCVAPQNAGPVDVTCTPVRGDGTARELLKDTPETISLQVSPTAAAPSQVCFDAVVTGLISDPEPSNNETSSCSSALVAKPELLTSKDDGKTAVSQGQTTTYTIKATNRLVAEPVAGVSLTDTLPADLELVSSNPAPTTRVGQVLTWELGTLGQAGTLSGDGEIASGAAGSSRTVTVTVRVADTARDTVTNTAEVAGTDPADDSVILVAEGSDSNTVANIFTDLNAAVSTPQNTAVHTALADIMSAAGAPLDPTSVTVLIDPSHGTSSVDTATGAVQYTPEAGYSGDDSYAIRVCDSSTPAQCATAAVIIHVGLNVVTAADDADSTDAGVAVTTDVRDGDVSQSGQALAAPTVRTGPAHGTTSVDAAGNIVYSPADGFSGTDSYTYQVCDTSTPDPVCDSATVTVTVANVFIDGGASVTTPHNTAATTDLTDVVTVKGAVLDLTKVTVATDADHGTVTLDAAGASTYTPERGYAGQDSYTLTVCDTHGECHDVTVPVTVGPNVVVAVVDTDSATAGAAVTTDVRANDTSASGQEFDAPAVVVDAAHGSTSVDGDGDVVYTPADGFSGTDSYTYRVCDTSTPDPVCDSATVTITVANVWTDQHASVRSAHNGMVTTALDAIATVAAAALDPGSVVQGAAPAHGEITADPGTGAVTYTPTAGYAGPDSYEITVCDTSRPTAECRSFTVLVTVAPNTVGAVNDNTTTKADTAVRINVRANDTTASGQPLGSPTVVKKPRHGTVTVHDGGTTAYAPRAGFSGRDSFTYRVCDTSNPTPVCDTATVTVTVRRAKFDVSLQNRLIGGSNVRPGDLARYRLQVRNLGPDAAPAPLRLTDRVPNGLKVVSAKGQGWRCTVENQKVVCIWNGDLSARGKPRLVGAAKPVIVRVRVTTSARGKLVNIARVSALGDMAKANNRARAVLKVAALPGLPNTGFRVPVRDQRDP